MTLAIEGRKYLSALEDAWWVLSLALCSSSDKQLAGLEERWIQSRPRKGQPSPGLPFDNQGGRKGRGGEEKEGPKVEEKEKGQGVVDNSWLLKAVVEKEWPG